MPKAAKASRGSGKESQPPKSKPYLRTRSAADPMPSAQAESSKAARSNGISDPSTRSNSTPGPSTRKLDDVPEEAAGRKKRRRRKARRGAAEEDELPQVNGGDADDDDVPEDLEQRKEPKDKGSAVVKNGSPSKSDTSYNDNLDQIRRRVFGTDTAEPEAADVLEVPDDESTYLPSPTQSRKSKYKTEARALRRRVSEMENTAQELMADLYKRIEELETTVGTQRTEIHQQAAELEIKTKLINDQGDHSDALREHLVCGVCFEAFDDPHILSCGHCACRKCLLDWFRSPNAYPAPDIETVEPGDDLSYRTKVCHMCRERIFRRPTRMFVMQHMVDTVGLTRGLPAEQQIVERDSDPWELTFPPEPTSWLIKDSEDHVNRCPRCLMEIFDYGTCDHCQYAFSHVGSDMSGSEDDDNEGLRMARIDLGNGLMMDNLSDLEEDDYDGNSFIDDEAEHSEEDVFRNPRGFQRRMDRLFNNDNGVHRNLMGGEDGYHNRMMDLINNIAAGEDEESEYDSDYEGMDEQYDRLDRDGRVGNRHDDSRSPSPFPVDNPRDAFQSPSPPPYAGPRRPNRYDDMYLEDSDGGYESSFIDDDVSGEAHLEELEPSSDDEDDAPAPAREADEPNLDELRERRAARYGVPRSPSVEVLEEQPRLRRSRRQAQRVIEVSDDE